LTQFVATRYWAICVACAVHFDAIGNSTTTIITPASSTLLFSKFGGPRGGIW
jgi:hypothetical protein